jgi:hypothetical protein
MATKKRKPARKPARKSTRKTPPRKTNGQFRKRK